MVFSSLLFLWLFLPVVVAGYYIVPSKCKNILLLISSLLFYAWGEPVYILLMLFSIFFNWGTGLLIDRFRKIDGILLAVNVVGNLALLGFFKYYDFFIGLVNSCFKTTFPEKNIPLPIGISFFTFQILSYVIDLYRGRYPVQKNILNLALYISFFPQLIAGPIVRYVDIERQLESRTHSTQKAMDSAFFVWSGEKGADCERSRTVRGQHLCDGAVRGNRGFCMAGSRNVYASDLL